MAPVLPLQGVAVGGRGLCAWGHCPALTAPQNFSALGRPALGSSARSTHPRCCSKPQNANNKAAIACVNRAHALSLGELLSLSMSSQCLF